MNKDDRDNIVQLFANAPEAPPKASVTNRDGVVIVGNTSGNVTINVTKPSAKPPRIAAPPPPSGCIDSGQQYELKTMVQTIVRTSRKNTTHGKVWASLKKRYRIPRYDHLPAAQYEDAYEYLRKWIGAAHAGRG
jgi:hypothetical protein